MAKLRSRSAAPVSNPRALLANPVARLAIHEVLAEVICGPVFLNCTRRIKMNLIFHEHGTEDSDPEIPVKKCLFRIWWGGRWQQSMR